MHSFSVICESIAYRQKVEYFYRRQYGSNFNRCDVTGGKATEFGEMTRLRNV